MEKLSFTNISNMSINDFLSKFHIAKSTIYKMKQDHLVTVNNQELDYDYILKKTDIISIIIDDFEVNKTTPWEYKLNIIHEDNDILIINKPIGILVHSDGITEHTLANAVSYYYQTKGIKRQIRHVHRLDFDTSGVIVYAKHFLAHSFLNHEIEIKAVKKTYLAIINGVMDKEEGVINLNIGRDRHIANKYRVTVNGKPAITKYRTLKKSMGRSVLEVNIESGRTHQIRVHFAHLLHPIVGDKIYGQKVSRLMLHASRISFIHPRSLNEVSYFAPTPKDFKI